MTRYRNRKRAIDTLSLVAVAASSTAIFGWATGWRVNRIPDQPFPIRHPSLWPVERYVSADSYQYIGRCDRLDQAPPITQDDIVYETGIIRIGTSRGLRYARQEDAAWLAFANNEGFHLDPWRAAAYQIGLGRLIWRPR